MTTTSLATAIDEAIVCAVKARNYDATFGQKMKEARRIAEEQGEAWETVLDTIVRPKLQAAVGDRQVRRLIQIARADDAEVADDAERERTRQRVAKIGRTTSAERNMPPLQKALAAVNALPPEERRHVAEIADVGARKAIAAPVSPRDALIRAIDAVDDETLASVLVRHAWRRIGSLIMAAVQTEPVDHDPETGEIFEAPTAAGPTPCPAVSPLGVQEPASGGDVTHPSPSAPAPKPDDAFDIPAFLDRRQA